MANRQMSRNRTEGTIPNNKKCFLLLNTIGIVMDVLFFGLNVKWLTNLGKSFA
jgi:hypothetical protein